MSEVGSPGAKGISPFALGTTLLRGRWRIGRWMVIGMVLALPMVFQKRPQYRATASFTPTGADAARSGLASLAGQFGVTLPSQNQSQSPDFYAELLESRELHLPIVRDTFVVSELGGRRIALLDLYGIASGSAKQREEQGIKVLDGLSKTSISKKTGTVELSVTTAWPSVSLAIAKALVKGVNDFNLRTRQGQATAERKFVEGRLALARADLRNAEDRVATFLSRNRQYATSPELSLERERLQRDLSLQQQVYTFLTQALEDARIREVRDTPVITLVESPYVPSKPEPRGRAKLLLFGLLLGGFIGSLIVVIANTVSRLRGEGNTEVDAFLSALTDVKGDLFGRVRRLLGADERKTN